MDGGGRGRGGVGQPWAADYANILSRLYDG